MEWPVFHRVMSLFGIRVEVPVMPALAAVSGMGLVPLYTRLPRDRDHSSAVMP
jgi:hypothetical protein